MSPILSAQRELLYDSTLVFPVAEFELADLQQWEKEVKVISSFIKNIFRCLAISKAHFVPKFRFNVYIWFRVVCVLGKQKDCH